MDTSSNRLKEPLVQDADPAEKGLQPLATAELAPDADALTFTGSGLPDFLAPRAGGHAALIVKAARPAEPGNTPTTFFHSREAAEGLRPILSWSTPGMSQPE